MRILLRVDLVQGCDSSRQKEQSCHKKYLKSAILHQGQCHTAYKENTLNCHPNVIGCFFTHVPPLFKTFCKQLFSLVVLLPDKELQRCANKKHWDDFSAKAFSLWGGTKTTIKIADAPQNKKKSPRNKRPPVIKSRICGSNDRSFANWLYLVLRAFFGLTTVIISS